MTPRANSRAEAIEVGSILADAAREIGRSLLRVLLRPIFAYARFVDRCDE